MTKNAAANRYARALLDVSAKDGDPQKAGQNLSGFSTLLSTHPTLERALTSPGVPPARKRAVISDLVRRVEEMEPPVARLLMLLAERDRLSILPQLVEAYQQRLLDHLGMVNAEITTAFPLPSDRTDALQRSLTITTGKKVSVVTQVDQAILGGVVARIGSTVYDGSLVRHLERMKEKLVEGE